MCGSFVSLVLIKLFFEEEAEYGWFERSHGFENNIVISHEIPVDCQMLKILGKTRPRDNSMWIMMIGGLCLFS